MSALSGRTNGEDSGLTESCRHAAERHKLIMSGAIDLEITDDRLGLLSASGTCGRAAAVSTSSSCSQSYLVNPQQERRRFALHSHPQHARTLSPDTHSQSDRRLKTHRPGFRTAA